MGKNRTAQLMLQTAYLVLGIVAIIASTGFFDYTYHEAFYVYFTNLSNYFCVGIIALELLQTLRKKEDSYVSAVPMLKFAGMMSIVLTFLVFNLLLAGAADRDPAMNYKIGSVLMHMVLPILFVADWVLFYEKENVKWFFPIVAATVPLIYAGFVFARAWLVGFDPSVPLLYPYFFLNLDTQGVLGVIRWIGILLAAFLAVGYLFFGLDKLGKTRKVRTNP